MYIPQSAFTTFSHDRARQAASQKGRGLATPVPSSEEHRQENVDGGRRLHYIKGRSGHKTREKMLTEGFILLMTQPLGKRNKQIKTSQKQSCKLKHLHFKIVYWSSCEHFIKLKCKK